MNMKALSSLILVFSLSMGTVFGGQVELANCSEMMPSCCCPSEKEMVPSCPVNSETSDCDCSLSEQQSSIPSALSPERHQDPVLAISPCLTRQSSLILSESFTQDDDPPPSSSKRFQTPYLRAPPRLLPIAA